MCSGSSGWTGKRLVDNDSYCGHCIQRCEETSYRKTMDFYKIISYNTFEDFEVDIACLLDFVGDCSGWSLLESTTYFKTQETHAPKFGKQTRL